MNSLNILSARVIGQTTSDRPRSFSEGNLTKSSADAKLKRSASQYLRKDVPGIRGEDSELITAIQRFELERQDTDLDQSLHLKPARTRHGAATSEPTWPLYKRLLHAVFTSLKYIASILLAPWQYILSGCYDEKGYFSVINPVRKTGLALSWDPQTRSKISATTQRSATKGILYGNGPRNSRLERSTASTGSNYAPDIHDADTKNADEPLDQLRIARSEEGRVRGLENGQSLEARPGARRSPCVRLENEGGDRRRRQRLQDDTKANPLAIVATSVKSPTSPASSIRIAKYPKALMPPRPLIPSRQPSYSTQIARHSNNAQKTLVIDLDETLIHSLAKGGRMSSGHMVEVKLNATFGYGGVSLGHQHPVLYYVHKRPHCDEFLRKVCRWYRLIVFTASVQEYADPVIDWLEQERKYFSGRFYRQHCTFRNGAYIKDLSSVEPDLSRIMILDNSPLSYIFHEDNAIPIEGWINDPTDNDLLHLVPVLEALQYVPDVRALLALRRGEITS